MTCLSRTAGGRHRRLAKVEILFGQVAQGQTLVIKNETRTFFLWGKILLALGFFLYWYGGTSVRKIIDRGKTGPRICQGWTTCRVLSAGTIHSANKSIDTEPYTSET